MIGLPFNPNQTCFIRSAALNSNQFNPNVPDTNNLIPHNLLWDFVENKLQWVNTLTNIIVQELGAGSTVVDNKFFVLVDFDFGDDSTAVKYDMLLPYKTIDAAILAAGDGDVIMVNPSTTPYLVTQNFFGPGISFYIWKGATVNVVNAVRTTGASDITILGDGNINFFGVPNLDGTYSGNFKLECTTMTLNTGIFAMGGSFSGNMEINVDKIMFGPGGNHFIWINPGYWATATKPQKFIINANEVELFSDVFVVYVDCVELNFNIKNYSYKGPGGNGAKDFYKIGIAGITYPVTNIINIDNFTSDKSLSVYSDSSFFFLLGNPLSNTFITGNFTYLGNGVATQLPSLIEASCSEFISFNGVANIINGAMLVDLNSDSANCKVIIDGKVYVDNSAIAFFEYLFSAYFVSALRLQIKADTVVYSPANHAVQIGIYTVASAPQVDISDCQIVNYDAVGAAPSLVAKAFGAFVGAMGPYGVLRLVNTRLVTTGVTSVEGGSIGEPVEAVVAYSNKPTLSIANTVPAMLGVLVDVGVTSDEF